MLEVKRKRGRPKKNDSQNGIHFIMSEELENVNTDITKNDFDFHALLAKIQGDPQTYREAINSPEG